MKHIALLLAIIIFALSAVSCGDLTYYKDANWYCTEEDFYDQYCVPMTEKILQLAEEKGCYKNHYTKHDGNGEFLLVVYDGLSVCIMYFYGHEYWGKCITQMHFLGTDESELNNYEAQKKYLDLYNEITNLFAYGIDEETNIYDDAYNSCVEGGNGTFENELHYDAMCGYVKYGVEFGSNKYSEDRKTNFYYFEGFLKGDLESVLAN